MTDKNRPGLVEILAISASILFVIVCALSLCHVWRYADRALKTLIVAALCFMAFGSVMAGVAFWRDFNAT